MSDKTAIQWTDATWNPTRGCSLVSAGCTNCYAMRQAHRFSGPGKPYEGLTRQSPNGPVWSGEVRLIPDLLDEPAGWREPRRVFVNSMSDLFHDRLGFDAIADVFQVMQANRRHVFQILTKRPDQIGEFYQWLRKYPGFPDENREARVVHAERVAGGRRQENSPLVDPTWPLPNVWLGVSVEDQKTAETRIPVLLQAPAALRFVSMEPLLEPVDLTRVFVRGGVTGWGPRTRRYDTLSGWLNDYPPGRERPRESMSTARRLDWVIVGGESGHGARPFDIEWARQIIDQCRVTETPVFVKQLGAIVTENSVRNPPGLWGPGTKSVSFRNGWRRVLQDAKGGDPEEWPQDLRVREFPEARA